MKTRFLYWALANSAFALVLTAGAIGYRGHVHLAGMLAVALVFCVYTIGSARLGMASLRGEKAGEGVSLAIRACPMIAMLGTVAGFLIAFSGGAGDVQKRVLGASTGLIATFVGISCTLMLMLLRYIVAPDER